jgi:TrmH family RNA methyltransferase
MVSLKSITSASNDQYRELTKLLSSHGLKKSGHYILSGPKVLKELQTLKPDLIEYAIYPHEEMLHQWNVSGLLLPADLFANLDVMGTGGPLMVVKKKPLTEWTGSPPEGLEIFCPLGDPKNVGALLRSALAFGATKVVLLKESASPYLPESLRAAAGSHLQLNLMEGPSLKDLRGPFVTLDGSAAQDASEFRWPRDVRLLVGEEGPGLSKAHQIEPHPVRIPMDQRLESLNASVAASIAMYAYRQVHSAI